MLSRPAQLISANLKGGAKTFQTSHKAEAPKAAKPGGKLVGYSSVTSAPQVAPHGGGPKAEALTPVVPASPPPQDTAVTSVQDM